VYYAMWCGRGCGENEFVCWCSMCQLGDVVDMLHVKIMTYSEFHLYSYSWLHLRMGQNSESASLCIDGGCTCIIIWHNDHYYNPAL
jgi:hypothetical protein